MGDSPTVYRLDGLVTSVAVKAPVRAATTGPITMLGLITVDGIALEDQDRVLVMNQADTTANGIYIASVSDTTPWQRAPDFDGPMDAVDGTLVLVRLGGSINSGANFRTVCSDFPINFGTSEITFNQTFNALLNPAGSASPRSVVIHGPGGTDEQGVLALSDFHPASPGAVVSNILFIAGSSVGDNTTIAGLYGVYVNILDDPSTTINNKGKLLGGGFSVSPKVARDNTPFDDVACLSLNNAGTASGTDCIYIGRNTGTGSLDWTTGIDVDANCFYGAQFNGAYSYVIDLGFSTPSVSAIRLPFEGSITEHHSGTDYQLLASDSQDNTVLGGGGKHVISEGDLLIVKNLPVADPHVVGALWSNSGVATFSAG